MIAICLTLMAGIAVGAHWVVAPPLPGVLSAAIATACLAAGIARDRKVAAGAVLISVWSVGLVSIQPWVNPMVGPDHILHQMDTAPQTFAGTVAVQPRYKFRRVSMIVSVADRQAGDRWLPTTGRIRVTVGGPPVPSVNAGDRVKFTAAVAPIGGYRNPGGFDFARFMSYRRVWARAWVPERQFEVVTAMPSDGAAWWRPARWRSGVDQWLSQHVIGDARAVLQSLIIGDRRNIHPDLRKMFNRLGIGHLLAISGLHMGIIALVSYRAARWLGVRLPFLIWRGWVDAAAAAITLLPLSLYGLLAGMSPSTQRALVMVGVVTLGVVAGRRHDPYSALAAAAVVILAGHPPALFDVSFQFSFMAVAGIIVGMPRLQGMPAPSNVMPEAPPTARWRRWLKNSLWVSLLATVATAPLAMTYFQQVSLVGCLANLVFVPIFGFLVIPLALAGTLMLVLCPPLGAGLIHAAAAIVNLGLWLGRALAAVPYISVNTFIPTMVELVFFYGWGGWLLFRFISHRPAVQGAANGTRARRAYGGRAVSVAVLVTLVLVGSDAIYWMHRRFWHRDLRITFLDVGQGSAALVAFPGGQVMLVDGGGSAMPDAFDVGAGVIAPFLRRERIFTINTMVLTHANSDHLNGLLHLAETFRVNRCWTNGAPAETTGYRRFRAILDRRGIPHPDYSAVYGRHRIGAAEVRVLYPPKGIQATASGRNLNDDSLVMKISFHGCAVLLTGDITAPAEAALMSLHGPSIDVDVLQAPHHGSRTSSSQHFIDAVSPEAVVIPAGWRNRFGFPHPEVLRRYRRIGAVIWRVDTGGATVLSLFNGGWQCRQPFPIAR